MRDLKYLLTASLFLASGSYFASESFTRFNYFLTIQENELNKEQLANLREQGNTALYLALGGAGLIALGGFQMPRKSEDN